MKFALLITSFLTVISATQAQTVTLRPHCPDKEGQWRATCASYAPVYTALSTQYNAAKGYRQSDPDFRIFSYGFVASKMKANKPFFQRLFNRCGKHVTADMALQVLQQTGTVTQQQFPHNCDCAKQKQAQRNQPLFRIASFKEIGDINTPSATHISAIKSSLDQKVPVVTAILQTGFFISNREKLVQFPEGYTMENASANHVVCIVGYDDQLEGGAFLVKNNYTNWGNDQGFAWVKYADMLKLIRHSFNMTL